MRHPWLAGLALAAALAAPASAWETPARGTQLRTDLMDVLRAHAEWWLGAPVEFVVSDLRVSGDVAFASVLAQRPGGIPIDMATAPGAIGGALDPDTGDVPVVQALMQRSGRMWVGVHVAIEPTDLWYAWDGYCRLWAPVLPEYCD